MRIVAVADTHTFQDDLGVLPEGDVLVHAGDMLRAGTLDELRPVAQWLNAQPHRHKIIVPGNHDVCFQTEPAEARALVDATVLVDEGIELEGVSFWGSPWQPQHPEWGFHRPPDRIGEAWAKIPQNVDVLITHTPPRGIGDRVSSDTRVGCLALSRAIAQVTPRLHMFGHVHQEGGVWNHGRGWLANVTVWECERPPTVVSLGANVVWEQVPPTDPLALKRIL